MLGVFLDTETSGLDPFVHVPLEIAFLIVDLFSGRELVTFSRVFQVNDAAWERRDLKSIEINGLAQQDLKAGVTCSQAAQEIEVLFSKYSITNDRALFICQNPAFDRPFFTQIVPAYRQEELQWPYHWLDLASMYWALKAKDLQKTSPYGLPVSKNTIAKALGLPPESNPHRALNGARHLLACYERLVGFPGA